MGANKQRVDSDGTSIDGFVTLLNDFATPVFALVPA